jgi:hypothetical protein
MDGHNENMQVDLSEALAQDGQLIITNEDGNGKNLIRHPQSSVSHISIAFSFPSWNQRNDNATSYSADVSLACPTTDAEQRQHGLRHTYAGTEFHIK